MTPTPPTYPARPVNGGPLPQALKHPRPGVWSYSGKVNGWRTLVHVPTGTMFNRKGELLSIDGEFTRAIEILKAFDIAEWLDCEALERRHGIGKGSLIVLDVPMPGVTYEKRHAMISREINTVLAWNLPENTVRCLPLIASAFVEEAWGKLQAENAQLGCEFWEGVVGQRAGDYYPLQLRSPNEESKCLVKHRWAF